MESFGIGEVEGVAIGEDLPLTGKLDNENGTMSLFVCNNEKIFAWSWSLIVAADGDSFLLLCEVKT